ncbi:MAG: stage III sporulation protein AC [Clostridia bacterium]|nr:stage III sporulation protein AC [Clostridia bacterium]
MDLSLLMKIAGIGMLVAVVCQILSKMGKDDQSTMVSIGGIILIMLIIVEELGELIDAVKGVFGI